MLVPFKTRCIHVHLRNDFVIFKNMWVPMEGTLPDLQQIHITWIVEQKVSYMKTKHGRHLDVTIESRSQFREGSLTDYPRGWGGGLQHRSGGGWGGSECLPIEKKGVVSTRHIGV